MRQLYLAFFLSFLVTSAWSSGGQGTEADKKTDAPQAEGAAAPADTTGEDSQPADKMFALGPEDVIVVRVWREPELSGEYVIRPDGRISLPLVGEIQAAGLTPEKLADAIGEGLSKYMKRPEVSVSVRQVNSRKFYIQGEVNRSGGFPLTVPTRVLEALSNGGGFKDFADTKHIIIIRGDQRLKFNYKDVIKGKNTEQNILLEPGDQIIVP